MNNRDLYFQSIFLNELSCIETCIKEGYNYIWCGGDEITLSPDLFQKIMELVREEKINELNKLRGE